MKIYQQVGNIKAALFLGGILLVGSLLFYTQSIIDDLRKESREVVSLYAQLMVHGVTESEDAELDFIFREIIQKVKFPVIYSGDDNIPINWRNLTGDETLDVEVVQKYMVQMDKQNSPIPLVYSLKRGTGQAEELVLGYFHYGDSKLIRQLQWLPYIEIGAVALFIFLGFVGFQVIRNNEKRNIWFGLARETAHQLGTPVSSLMGWLDRMREYPEKSKEIVPEIEKDMGRLQQISDRFSKMGSPPRLEKINLNELIHSVLGYFERRLPKTGRAISLEFQEKKDVFVLGNSTILSWAIENIVKNAVDSIEGNKGRISLSIHYDNRKVVLNITDTGRGIPKSDVKNVFRPGYSTKKLGWGLGLSLTKRIIEEFHNGKIKITASEIGEGTTFEVRLPTD
ncbi:MAG: HAMP domain-containing histidine kinase [Candidatus Marinimicrobia bacterium]|nr:HAMP domain-containing histidine kinase [Candidatus Neomarinimicrobiota bacterium]MBL7046111.1 HAMP domain-containing histidine kinase [Candidatus Neomarinimicrobiota bacterium]